MHQLNTNAGSVCITYLKIVKEKWDKKVWGYFIIYVIYITYIWISRAERKRKHISYFFLYHSMRHSFDFLVVFGFSSWSSSILPGLSLVSESCVVGEIELLAPFLHEVVWWFQILGVDPLKWLLWVDWVSMFSSLWSEHCKSLKYMKY